MQIKQGMYRLTQAGILANKILENCLAPYGYYELTHTPNLWKHINKPIQLSLAV